jgi:phage gpG-like protein
MRNNLLKDTARMAAGESVKFFKESFVKGGFTDSAFERWAVRKSPIGSKKLMRDVGTLMQSIRATEGAGRVTVLSDTQYSEIHNDGGEITVTAQMKKYWWSQYYRFAGVYDKNPTLPRTSNPKAKLRGISIRNNVSNRNRG